VRIRGDLQPSAAFTLEAQPKRPGFVLARFFENAVPFEETKDGTTIKGYEYDEYQLELEDTGGLEADITSNFAAYLAQAKAAEPESAPEGLENRVATLETSKADKDEVQAVWDQMAAAYSEGVRGA